MKSYILFLAIFLAETVTNGDHVHESKMLNCSENLARLREEICFPQIGCFHCKQFGIWPFSKCYDPWSPLEIEIKLLLLTRKKRNIRRLPPIYPDLPTENLIDYGYKPHKKTVFIIHGFETSSQLHVLHQIAQAYLDREDVNILLTDWRKGAAGKGDLWNEYGIAAANTEIVGAVLARFVTDLLVVKYGQDLKNIHVIGFSLGGQVAGFFGKNVMKNKSFSKKTRGRRLGKITGLDPAGPGFEGYPADSHLTAEDADYVEVVHTNGLRGITSFGMRCQNQEPSIDGSALSNLPNIFGFGTADPIGTVDFYMNGGGHQPGCLENDFSEMPEGPEGVRRGHTELEIAKMSSIKLEDWMTCSHRKAPAYYAAALNSPDVCFVGHKLTKDLEHEMFQSLTIFHNKLFYAKTLPECERKKNNCLALTLETDGHEPVKGVLYTPVASQEPWCL